MKDFRIKRICSITALLLAAIMCLAFSAACKKEAPAPQKQADLSKVYDSLVESGKLPHLTKVPERDLSEAYGIDASKIKQWVVALSDNYAVDAGEVALFEVNDESYVTTLVEKLQNHIDRIRMVAKEYSDPHQSEKLEPVEITSSGSYVYFVVGEDYEALMQIIKDNIG